MSLRSTWQDIRDQTRWRLAQLRPRITQLEYRRADGTQGIATVQRGCGLGLICQDGPSTFLLEQGQATDRRLYSTARLQHMPGPIRLRTEDGEILREDDLG